jgi:hypothetical protein
MDKLRFNPKILYTIVGVVSLGFSIGSGVFCTVINGTKNYKNDSITNN